MSKSPKGRGGIATRPTQLQLPFFEQETSAAVRKLAFERMRQAGQRRADGLQVARNQLQYAYSALFDAVRDDDQIHQAICATRYATRVLKRLRRLSWEVV